VAPSRSPARRRRPDPPPPRRALSYPDSRQSAFDLDASTAPFLAIDLRRDDVELQFFTTLASLGTPYDITLHELRIESFFPANSRTEEAAKRLAQR
jgi:hypothetical protein